jgi:AcrR family transcriptional regulator
MSTVEMAGRTRLSAAERGEQVLAAAVSVFAECGYEGARTDEIARRVGVSQPYVLRLFGTKQQLFLATQERVCDRLEQRFRAAGGDHPDLDKLGSAYKDFLAERELLQVLLHGFAASADPVVGDRVRARFGRIYHLVRDLTGASAAEARDFLAYGMLLTVLAAMHVAGPQAVASPWAAELLAGLVDDPAEQ